MSWLRGDEAGQRHDRCRAPIGTIDAVRLTRATRLRALAGPAFGLALPLLPAQILWVNLLTHGLPGVAPSARIDVSELFLEAALIFFACGLFLAVFRTVRFRQI